MVVVRLEAGLVITNEDPRMAAQAKCSHEEGWVSCVRRSVVVGWACHFFTPYSIELVLTCQALLSSTGATRATGGVVLLEVSCELPSRKMHKARVLIIIWHLYWNWDPLLTVKLRSLATLIMIGNFDVVTVRNLHFGLLAKVQTGVHSCFVFIPIDHNKYEY